MEDLSDATIKQRLRSRNSQDNSEQKVNNSMIMNTVH